jgi:hypothetical protein
MDPQTTQPAMAPVPAEIIRTPEPPHQHQQAEAPGSRRYSPARLALAFGIAAASDVASFLTEFVPPAQWAIDFATALLLFVVLGRRWAILPGLITEAIPGLGIFPVWILVVASIVVYDKVPKKGEIR